MLNAIIPSLAVFAVTFIALRLIEGGYHHLHHTPDWSPHWGTWLFALLLGVYVFVESIGR